MENNATKAVQLAIRVTGRLLEALDRRVERLRRAKPGMSVNRSDVVRECLHRCLNVGIPKAG